MVSILTLSINTCSAVIAWPGAAVAESHRAEPPREAWPTETVEGGQTVNTLRVVLTAAVLLAVVNVLLAKLSCNRRVILTPIYISTYICL